MIPFSPGKMHIIEHNNAIAEPHNAVAGNRILWFDVPRSNLDMCGTASPMNEIGPQNAVVTAVSIPVDRSNMFLVRCMFTPKFSAYLVPNRRAFIGFISMTEIISPINIIMENAGICDSDTPPKLPMPHVTYECTPSAVEKKFSREMTDEVT